MVEKAAENSAIKNLRMASIVAALLVCVFTAGVSWLSWRDENARQLKSLSALAELGAQTMDAYFLGLQVTLRLASQEILDADDNIDLARAESVLKRIQVARPELRVLMLARADGQIVAATPPMQDTLLASLAAQPAFVAMRDMKLRTRNRDISVGRASFGPLSREWVIPLGHVAWTRKGEMALILGAVIPLSKVQSFWQDVPLPANAALGLRRDDGYILVRSSIPDGRSLEDLFAQPSFGPLGAYLRDNNHPQRGHVTGASRISGDDTMFVFRRLSSFPLTLFVTNPTANIRAAWWDRVWDTYLLILLLLLGGYYVYRWTLNRQVSRESERARQIGMLEAANQELEDFAYTIAHDLKAPARAIDGHAGIALETFGKDMPDGLRHRLGLIRRSAGRMGELIDDLLEFSRYSHAPLTRQSIDMTALAREVVAEQVPADGGIDLSVAEMPACAADPRLIRVVWTALVSNAVKYSRKSLSPVIQVGFSNGAYFVRDNGVGFDMAHSAKLFGVFSRLHGVEEFEGTGAGLAIARRILERHEGTIEAQGEPGRGATFRFTVGAAQAN